MPKPSAKAFINYAYIEIIKSIAKRKPTVTIPRHLLRLYYYLYTIVKLSPSTIVKLVY